MNAEGLMSALHKKHGGTCIHQCAYLNPPYVYCISEAVVPCIWDCRGIFILPMHLENSVLITFRPLAHGLHAKPLLAKIMMFLWLNSRNSVPIDLMSGHVLVTASE